SYESLVGLGKITIELGRRAVIGPRFRYPVHHDRRGIERRSGYFVARINLEHVMFDGVPIPIVWRTGEIGDHGRLIPVYRLDRILMLMDQTKSVAELVQNDLLRLRVANARIQPPEIHRRLVVRHVLARGSYH